MYLLKMTSRKKTGYLDFRDGTAKDYTVAELKTLAKRRHLSGYSKLRKSELCELLKIPPDDVNIFSKIAPKITPKNTLPNYRDIRRVRDCDYKKVVFPCKLKGGYFADKSEWDEYVKLKRLTFTKTRQNRNEVVRLANIELIKEKELLKSKKKASPRVKFNV